MMCNMRTDMQTYFTTYRVSGRAHQSSNEWMPSSDVQYHVMKFVSPPQAFCSSNCCIVTSLRSEMERW